MGHGGSNLFLSALAAQHCSHPRLYAIGTGDRPSMMGLNATTAAKSEGAMTRFLGNFFSVAGTTTGDSSRFPGGYALLRLGVNMVSKGLQAAETIGLFSKVVIDFCRREVA